MATYGPFPYILFIILYPVNGNKTALLASSFMLGLFLDMFTNSGGSRKQRVLFWLISDHLYLNSLSA